MKILVTGSKGMLGTAIKEIFANHNLILTDSIELDVRNIKQVLSYASLKPELILHLAAITDHFAAEFNPTDAYFTNYTGTQNMIELARLLDIPIVYISTGGIFDGKKEIYTEDDIPNPINHYSRSKYYGECAIKSYDKYYIIRAGWMMGGGPTIDKKFINKIFTQIKAGKKELYALTNAYGSPTYTYDLAKTIKNLIEKKVPYGIYHSAGSGMASRYDIACAFVHFLGLAEEIKINPMTFDEFHTLFPLQCAYTKNEVLSIEKIRQLGLSAMRDWREALKEYTEKEFKPCL
jgi:dTDP-4-dehydrorhamnose reductase